MANLKDLLDLAEFVSKRKLKDIDNFTNPSSIFTKFFGGLVLKKFETDQDACKYIYGEKKISNKYQKLKSRVYDRLISNLFLINVNSPKFSEIKSAYQTCQRNLAAINILINNYHRKPAITLAEKTLKKSEFFEFTDISLGLSHILWLHYGTVDLNSKKQKKYSLLLEKYYALTRLEIKAQRYYQASLISHKLSKRFTSNQILEARNHAKELVEIIENHHSYQLMLYSCITIINSYEMDFDYDGIIKTVKKFETYLKKKPHLKSENITFVLNAKLLISYISTKNFIKAKEASVKGLSSVPQHSLNWFIIKYYQIILFFHFQRFERAYIAFSEVYDNPSINNTFEFIQELMRINSAYIHYLIRIGKIKLDRPRKFRIGKFLNEVPRFSKDKRGANISILIIQVLFHLELRNYDPLLTHLEALRRYRHRYLRRDDTFRSNCFIRMLELMPAADFHAGRVAHRARPLLAKLRSVPPPLARQPAELELIPYEVLWEFVLESLGRRR